MTKSDITVFRRGLWRNRVYRFRTNGFANGEQFIAQGHQLRVFDVNAEAVRHLVEKVRLPPPTRRRPLKMPNLSYHVAEWRSGAQRVVR